MRYGIGSMISAATALLALLFIVIGVALVTTGLFFYGAVELLRHHPLPEFVKRHLHSANCPPDCMANATVTPDDPSKDHSLRNKLRSMLKGDVVDDAASLLQMSRDTSIFVRTPDVVVYPKDASDVSSLVREIAWLKHAGNDVSVTARAAGTDMSGGPLTRSVVAVFTKYMNKVREVREEKGGGYAITEPGVYYRDFEKETLAHGNLMLQSYPASRELAAMGGIISNNSGGERTLEYGKTEKYIEEMDVVLSDGSLVTLKELNPEELEKKKELRTFEGEIYRKMDELLTENASVIKHSVPKVSKNSAGYALWNVRDTVTRTFNLAKLMCGAQGTLGIMTSAKLRLVKDQANRSMLVAFLAEEDMVKLPEIVHAVLPHNPESFESFDQHTLSLAVKFMPGMLWQMGPFRAARLGLSFLPEVRMVLTGGAPFFVLMAEFSEDTHETALAAATAAEDSLKAFNIRTRILADEVASEKYWIVRRESFALLRKHSKGLYAAPFIDDLVVPPEVYPEFLPELNALLDQYKKSFVYTIAGHIGNGNFHIIPLMDLSKPEVRDVILELSPKVYDLVLKYGGTTTGEHNDGIIRTPYIKQQFGDEMYGLFTKTKEIFDPQNIFNPGKKIGGTFEDIKNSMLTQTS
jgi:FAD/FMN-containing dehydrogenase